MQMCSNLLSLLFYRFICFGHQHLLEAKRRCVKADEAKHANHEDLIYKAFLNTHANIPDMSVTLETFHSEISTLK